MARIAYFSDVATSDKQLEVISDDQIIRKGLIFYAGDHTDSKQRHHEFPEDRVYEIVENTNRLIEDGQFIPVLKDHTKTVDSAVGHIESALEVRPITKKDLPNPKMTKLIGKLGVFCDGIVLKGKDIVSKFISGAVKTVSPGIDVTTNTMRELSLTPVPAIPGLSLYNRGNTADFALTFDELEQEGSELDAAQEKFEQLSENFWSLIVNISGVSEEELSQMQTDPETLMNQAIEDYVLRIQELIGMGGEEQQDPQMQMQQQGGIPPQQQKQQMQPPMNRGRGQFTSGVPLAAYSMTDMATVAEFGYRKAITGAVRALQNRQATKQTVGQIGQQFGRKMLNATRGKLAGAKRLVGKTASGVKRTFTGNTIAGSTKLSAGQRASSLAAKNKFGVKNVKPQMMGPAGSLNQTAGYMKKLQQR